MVVNDEDPPQSEVVREHRGDGAVGVVGAITRAKLRWPVGKAWRVTTLGHRPGAREVGGGGGGADHGERASWGAVSHGDLEAAAEGLVRSDDADDAWVGGVGPSVAPAAHRVGAVGLRGGVIAGLVADGQATGAKAVLP